MVSHYYANKRDPVSFQPEDLIPATAIGQPGKSALEILDLETLVPESVTKNLQQATFLNFVFKLWVSFTLN